MGCCICTSLNIQSSRCFYKPLRKKTQKNAGDIGFLRFLHELTLPRAETDEDFIEEMFSEVGVEQDHDGFHVV